ncbi:hypothetical protein SLS54_003136 [Diplodia seriata]
MASFQEDSGISLRAYRPEDIPHIISRHGALYADEHGWDPKVMESLVDSTCVDFINTYDPSHDRLWIAERHQNDAVKFVGCVMLFNDREDLAQKSAMVRLLLVEPEERGRRVGTRLVRQAVQFAREEAGYRRVLLWMPGETAAARRIYQREGFEKVAEMEHDVFGKKAKAESWGLNF